MPSYSRDDLESMASDIVSSFLSKKASLEDGILAKAKESMMNSDQIKRLVEMANTSAFLDMFKGTSGDDRMVEFKVADPSVVIKRYYNGKAPDGSPAHGVSETKVTVIDHSDDSDDSNFFDDISSKLGCGCDSGCDCHDSDDSEPESLVDSIRDMFETSEKTASLKYDSDHGLSGIGKFRKQDIQESLLSKMAACEYDFSDAVKAIHSEYRGVYSRSKHAEFELDCFSRFGNSAIPALQAVRSKLAMPGIERPLTDLEISVIRDRHIVEKKASIDYAGMAIKAASDYSVYSAALGRLSDV